MRFLDIPIARALLPALIVSACLGAAIAATAAKPPDDAVAQVNDRHITRAQLVAELVRRDGAAMRKRLVTAKLIRHAAAARHAAYAPEELEQRLNAAVEERVALAAQMQGCDSVETFADDLKRAGQSIDAVRKQLREALREDLDAQLLLERMVDAGITVSDEEVRQAFDDRYGPKAKVRQIILATRAEADETLARLKAGADFVAMVRARSVDEESARNDGLASSLPRRGPLGAAAFALKPGEISGVVQTPAGYHILRLEEIATGSKVAFAKVEAGLRGEIRRRKLGEQLPGFLDKLRADATAADKKIDASLVEKELLQREGFAVLGVMMRAEAVRQEAERRDIGYTDEEFQARVRRAVEDEFARRARQAGYRAAEDYALALKRANQSIAEVREQIESAARAMLPTDLLVEKMVGGDIAVDDADVRRAFDDAYGPRAIVAEVVCDRLDDAEAALARLKAGDDFTAVVKRFSVDRVSAARDGFMQPLPDRGVLGEAAFALAPGRFSDVLRTREGYHILRLVRRIPAQDVKLEDVRAALDEQVRRRKIRDAAPLFLDRLYVKTKFHVLMVGAP